MTETFCHEVPSQVAVRRFVDELTNVMFPVRDDKHISEVQIAARWEKLQQDFLKIICPLCSCKQVDCKELTQKFFGEIPLVYTGLVRDAEMYSTCDPASYCIEEVILCYPGFYAIMVYRIAHIAYRLQDPGTAQGDDRVRAQPDRNRHQPRRADRPPISTSTTAPAS